MKRLTVATAALAAGMLAVVAQSQAESDRSFRSLSIAAGTMSKPAKPAEAGEKPAEAGDKKTAVKAKDDTKPRLAAGRSKSGKKARTKIDVELAAVDKQTTASVKRARPELKAIARKGVKGMLDGTSEGEIAGGAAYTTLVAHYATSYGVPASLAHAVISVESNYRPNARGSAGEVGLMQIKPATARMMGYSGSTSGLFNPETNIKYGMKYLAMAHQLSGGSTCGTILRYNAGHAASRMNPVSAAYCSKVRARLPG